MNLEEIRKKLIAGESLSRIPLRVAFYARVSTEKEEQQNSLENQVSYYETMIRQNGYWHFSGAYIDEGISGTGVERRTSFLRMIRDAEEHRFDLILTKEISRFSRNTLDSLTYTRKLLNCGVGVYFESDGINTLLPDAELRLTILSSMAQEEVRKLSDRVKFGFRRAQEKGVVLGNDNLFGYRKSGGKLSIVPEEAETVKRIFRLYADERCGIRRIARILEEEGKYTRAGKPFCYATVYGILKNPKYKGCYAGKKTATPDFRLKKRVRLPEEEWLVRPDASIPAVVDEELWNEANRLLKERGKNVKEKKIAFQNRYSYSGRIFCAAHGTAFHRILIGKAKKEAWFCREYRLKGKSGGCGGPFFYTEELDEVMKKVWERVSLDRDGIASLLKDALRAAKDEHAEKAKRGEGEKKRRDLLHRKEKLFELHDSGFLSGEEFYERNESINARLRSLDEKIEREKDSDLAFAALENSAARFSERLVAIRSDPDFIGSCNRECLQRILVSGSRAAPRLEIILADGKKEAVGLGKSILICDMGISQAQVSRLEKSALERIRKQM